MSASRLGDQAWSGGLAGAGLAAIAGYVAVTVWAMDHTSVHFSRGMAAIPLFLVAMLALASWWGRDDPALARVLRIAAVARVGFPALFYGLVGPVFEGSADAAVYSDLGAGIAQDLRRGVVDLGPEALGGFTFPGTATIIVATGLVFAVVGTSALVGFLVFSLMAFVGQYLLYRAARVAAPGIDHRLYAWLLLLLPSMLFWTSATGKEAWVLLCLGAAALGVARWLRGERSHKASAAVLLGLGGLGLVRPHVAVLVAAAAVAALARRLPATRRRRHGLLLLAALALGTVAIVTLDVLRVDEADAPILQALDRATVQSGSGGSVISAPRATTPLAVPAAAVTVLLRPLPHEARSPSMLLAALEGVVLMGLAVRVALRRGALLHLRRLPYATFAGVYVVLFVVAFSYMANLGLLARQRVQVLPFLLLLLVPGTEGATRSRA